MKALGEFVRELSEKGYIVRYGTFAKGRSGTSHRIRMLVEAPDFRADEGGNSEKKRVVCLESGKESDAVEMIRVFAVAYDLDARACYILNGAPSGEVSKLAEYYGIKFVSTDK